MYGEHVLADWLYAMLGGHGLPQWLASHGLASTIAVSVLTYFHIVIGEMVPKSVALQYAEQMALWITPPMLWIRNALFPFVVALNTLGNQVLKVIGVNRHHAGSAAGTGVGHRLGESHMLQVNINRLRHKIEDDHTHPRYLLTKVGVAICSPSSPIRRAGY